MSKTHTLVNIGSKMDETTYVFCIVCMGKNQIMYSIEIEEYAIKTTNENSHGICDECIKLVADHQQTLIPTAILCIDSTNCVISDLVSIISTYAISLTSFFIRKKYLDVMVEPITDENRSNVSRNASKTKSKHVFDLIL
jgi:RNA polymerase-binding transcription factor DksA